MVADFAAAALLPARHTADPRIIQLRSDPRPRYASLYAYLTGSTIPWEAYTKEHIKLLGKAMSDMHSVLATLPAEAANLPHVADEYTAIVQRMEVYFADAQVQAAMHLKLHLQVSSRALAKCRAGIAIGRQLAGQHALHMDFVRGNILFDTKADQPYVSGILDFEKTAYGHPLFDIARTLAFLLVDCKYKQPDKVRKYFLQSGYNKCGASIYRDITIIDRSNNDISIIELLLDMFLLYDFYKFLRHNPYEHVGQNEHFVRTKHILINRNIIHATEVIK